MDIPLYDALVKWLRTFPGYENIATEILLDGVALGGILHLIAPEVFSSHWKSKIRSDVVDNWRLKVSNLRKIHQGVMDYFCSELAGQAIDQFPNPDLNKIGEHGDEIELGRLLQLILGCAINCQQKQKHIEAIMGMEEGVQALIVNAIQDLMNGELPQSPVLQDGSHSSAAAGGSSGPWFGPASFHPQMKTLVEQLESTSLAKEDMTRRCNALDLQISVLTEENSALAEDNKKLDERVEGFLNGADSTPQGSRYKELKKQVDTLQDELYKLESSRDEYRGRSEDLQKENSEVTLKNEELQKLADEARSLKDEVDALRDMSDRVAVYEGTVETYKKKMEELSDLKRQIKILEEKNSDYMHINMELEEEVKKSGTWRPQLELYKKQVADLHQKLSEEAKKTDRQIFDNKKIQERLEAITQEKERMILERDMLKENVEELKMSAYSSPETTSRPNSDLDDMHTLEIIPPEIRERLVRLQHENRVLKQKADERPNESGPVLQSMLNDLQERHDKLLQENRWEEKKCPSDWPSWGRTRPPTQSLLDAFFMYNTNTKLKMLKRNLKWASESDLLILRQPSELLSSSNSKTLTLPHSYSNSNSSPRRHSKALTLPKFEQKDSSSTPIVIHHIHEFKIPPPPGSPTNEDSGCCRTSPSSCEEQLSSFEHPLSSFDDRNGGGTLDSGISGMYHRCLSPAIPCIVEECTTHHMSDILPALMGQDNNNPNNTVLYHSHPTHHSHTNCNRCCSPQKSFVPNSNSINTKQNPSSCFSEGYHFLPKNGLEPYSSTEDEVDQSLKASPLRAPNPQPKHIPPPESPTPHNSPRLPHSIHSSRIKKPTHSSNNINRKAFLDANNKEFLEKSRANSMKKNNGGNVPKIVAVDLKENELAKRTTTNILVRKNAELKLSQEDLLDMPDNNIASSSSSSRINKSTDRVKAMSERAARSKTPDRIRSFLPERFRSSFRERSESVSPEKKIASGGPYLKNRSKSLDKYKAKVSSKFKIGAASKDDTTITSDYSKDIISKQKDSNVIDSIIIASKERPETNKSILIGKSSLPPPTSSKGSRELEAQDRKEKESPINKRGSMGFCSLRVKSTTPSPTKSSSSLLSKATPFSSKSSLSQASCASSNSNNVSVDRLNRKDKDIINHKRNPSKTNSADITLLTDTMFTHFIVTPKNKNKKTFFNVNDSRYNSSPSSLENCNPHIIVNSRSPYHQTVTSKVSTAALANSIPLTARDRIRVPPQRSASLYSNDSRNGINGGTATRVMTKQPRSSSLYSTGSDLDFMENKLAASAFGAPLVSSESSMSFLHSDLDDLNPSATDYNTDHISFIEEEDFDPVKYKLHSTKTLLETDLDDAEFVYSSSEPRVSACRPLTKLEKKRLIQKDANLAAIQNKTAFKVKNKTAKAVVAETFNAMFTFCTP